MLYIRVTPLYTWRLLGRGEAGKSVPMSSPANNCTRAVLEKQASQPRVSNEIYHRSSKGARVERLNFTHRKTELRIERLNFSRGGEERPDVLSGEQLHTNPYQISQPRESNEIHHRCSTVTQIERRYQTSQTRVFNKIYYRCSTVTQIERRIE